MDNKLFNLLFLDDSGHIAPKHQMAKIIYAKNIKLINGYADQEDILQDIITITIEATDKFISRGGKDTEQYLINHINNTEHDRIIAAYWRYINIRVSGALKNKYLVTKKEEQEDISFDLLENIISGELDLNNTTDTNYFCRWFKSNYKRILTASQINFIHHDLKDSHKHAKRRRDAIKERINNKYKKEIGIMDNKTMELEQVVAGAGEISNAHTTEELKAAMRKYRNEYFYIETIYSLKTSKVDKLLINKWLDNKTDEEIPTELQNKIKKLFTAIYIDLGAIVNLRKSELNNI